MDRSSRAVAELAKRADETSRRAAKDAEDGGVIVQKSIEGISRVSTAMTQSAGVMRELNKRTTEISGIVDTINLIAERTNLLSLNASIEAARAGDAGRGFAVVAEEIRNLADRCAKATADISQIVKGLTNVTQEATTSSNEGLRIAEESNRQSESGLAGLKKILAGVNETSTVVGQITRAAEEQLVAGKHVLDAINATNAHAREVASATAEQAKSAANIAQASVQMRKISKEVAQAMGEHGRAAREVTKAAQNTTTLAAQVRKASAEQAVGANQIVQAVDSMRRGSTNTARALAEQATASEQVSKEAVRLASMITGVSRAMAEQASASSEIATAADSLRQQTEQASRAMTEQAKAMKELTTGSQNIGRQIRLITTANIEHSKQVEEIVASLDRTREVAEENGVDAQSLRTITESLLGNSRPMRRARGIGAGAHETGSNGHDVPRELVRKNGRQ
jgi:methyl-accepting chemotaxis protein